MKNTVNECRYCGKKFDTNAAVTEHVVKEHSQRKNHLMSASERRASMANIGREMYGTENGAADAAILDTFADMVSRGIDREMAIKEIAESSHKTADEVGVVIKKKKSQ